jgi:hypothetical protein
MTPMIKVGVASSCGHSWDETRPAGLALPEDGEVRVCGHPDHWPAEFPVTYSEPVEVTERPPLMGVAELVQLPYREPL